MIKNKYNLFILIIIALFSLFILFEICLEINFLFLIALVLIILFLLKPKRLLLALIPTVATIVVMSQNETYNYPEIFFILTCISFAWSIRRIINKDKEINNNNLLYLIFAFFAISLVAGFLKGSFVISDIGQILFTNVPNPLFGFRLISEFLFASMLILIVSNEFKKEESHMFVIPIVIGTLILILGSAGYLKNLDLTERFSAFHTNPNKYSELLLIFVPIFLSFAFFGNRFIKWASIPILLVLFSLISLSISRSSIVLALGIIAFFVVKNIRGLIKLRKYKSLLLLAIGTMGVIILLSQIVPVNEINDRISNVSMICEDTHPNCRDYMYEYAIDKSLENPLFGNGVGSYVSYWNEGVNFYIQKNNTESYFSKEKYIKNRNVHLHNIILDTSYNTGIIGLILITSLLFLAIKKSYQNRNSAFKEGIFYSAIIILGASILDMPLYALEIATIFCFILGISLIDK